MSEVTRALEPDDGEPSPEREAELRAAYEANAKAGKPPYDGVAIRTRGELSWVMRERRWSGEFLLADGYERADFSGANLSLATLWDANLVQANLVGANLVKADLRQASLAGARLMSRLWYTNLRGASLQGADLGGAGLWMADLSGANLEGADMSDAKVAADHTDAELSGVDMSGADLRGARMDVTTRLRHATLNSCTLLCDVVWNEVPLTRLPWGDVAILGDEYVARQASDEEGKRKDRATRLQEYQDAVLASRQVATALRAQGLIEDADRFAYRAQFLQFQVLRRQGKSGAALGSWLLDRVAGYGYKPMRSVWTYIAVILAFAAAYFSITNFGITPFLPTHSTPLAWYEALVLSVGSFHGRGLYPTGLNLSDPVAILAAGEAIIGLLIEITFIATFTQRFFAR